MILIAYPLIGETYLIYNLYELIVDEPARSIVERAKGKCALYRVHSGLRDGSAKHYEPVLVSIGPYHHGNPALEDMEEHKEHYLQVLLRRVMENGIDRYVDALTNAEGETQALDCYRDTHQMNGVPFGECMVRDGIFLIELFRGTWRQDRRIDMLFNRRWMMPLLMRDILLFENQVPLFVLRTLFALTDQTPDQHDLIMLFASPDENDHVNWFAFADTDKDFVELALGFFHFNGKPIPNLNLPTSQLDQIPHLLGLVYEALVVRRRSALNTETPEQQNRWWKSLSEFSRRNIRSPFARSVMKALVRKTREQPNNSRESWEPIWTAVALKEVGVKFQSAKDRTEAFYDIRFSNGVLSIPPLKIYDHTESFFRNLVAYEQYSKKYHILQQVGDYLHVMECLVKSTKDVELLRHCGIIDNEIGDDAKVSNVFTQISSGVYFIRSNFLYTEMYNEVNKFCKNPWNKRIAKLKNEYFGSPWSVISFLAAFLLLSLTILRTVYALLTYY